jgi:UDP-N-acetylmuramyl pentapeptide phosphotransferase/UDP-N-acetylglucosamine-1-phosphate transferase
MINAFNLCDGIDGFAGLMGVVISFCYAIIFYITEDVLFMAYCVVLIGLLTGFLRYNLSFKKKVFMGDTGSLFLGFMFYLFTMYFVTDQSIILDGFLPKKSLVYVASMCLFILPIIDSGSVFFFRALRKKSPFAADNNHLHHLALRYAKSHIKASLLLVGGLVFIIFVFARLSFTIPPNSTIALFFGLLLFLFVVVAILRRVPKSS